MSKQHLTKQEWIALFLDVGIDHPTMNRWHQEFERRAPEAHQSFLEWLGIAAAEITEIRAQARDTTGEPDARC